MITHSAMSSLTSRERQIVRLVAEGLTAKEIAHQLDLAPQTVKNHKTMIYATLGVKNSPEMIRLLTMKGEF